jgi:AraC-like DNA-binding protein
MTLYLVVSTTDGIEAAPYPTLKEAVAAWLENLNPCDAQRDLQRAFDEDGPEAVLEMIREMDYEQAEYLWNDGEERVEVVDIEWAVDRSFHDRITGTLEANLQDAVEDAATKQERDLLDSIESGYEGHTNRLVDCLSAALAEASDLCGYSSPEYKTIDNIINYITNRE